MIKIGWAELQKQKKQKEIKNKIKRFVKVIGYWVGLFLLACLVAPVLWILLVMILCL